jgi:hypothetical protein
VTGAGGLNQTLTVSYSNNTNAGSATANASYAGDANHETGTDSKTFAIAKAGSTVTVTCPAGPFIYTGSAQTPCTASVTGAGGLNQSVVVTYTNNTNVGTATASASYSGDANHQGGSDTKTFAIQYRWDGFLQPINDTAHDQGAMSKFKAGQTIPAKFVLKNAAGAVVQQMGNPEFTRTGNLGACDSSAAPENPETLQASVVPQYIWDGTQYHYNWSTKSLNAGLYRIFAKLADGTSQSVDICLTK